jgi:hypothetical protein
MTSYVTEQIRKSLENHVLELVQYGVVTAYYLKEPGQGRMMSTLVTFSPEGITLSGDLTPNRSGLVSSYGYGIGWFGSEKSEGYLCEKFLDKGFVPEVAADELRDPQSCWRNWSNDETTETAKLRIEKLDEIIEDLEGDNHDSEWLANELEEAGYTVDRWLDCLFCGPHCERIDTVDPPQRNPDTWTNHRPTRLVRPVYSSSSMGQLCMRKGIKR